MRATLFTGFILLVTLCISQTKQSITTVNVEMDPLHGKVRVILNADSDPVDNYKILIVDSKEITVNTFELRKAAGQAEISIVIPDLLPGNYMCLVYKGKEEVYKKEFFKDAILIEPAGTINPKN